MKYGKSIKKTKSVIRKSQLSKRNQRSIAPLVGTVLGLGALGLGYKYFSRGSKKNENVMGNSAVYNELEEEGDVESTEKKCRTDFNASNVPEFIEVHDKMNGTSLKYMNEYPNKCVNLKSGTFLNSAITHHFKTLGINTDVQLQNQRLFGNGVDNGLHEELTEPQQNAMSSFPMFSTGNLSGDLSPQESPMDNSIMLSRPIIKAGRRLPQNHVPEKPEYIKPTNHMKLLKSLQSIKEEKANIVPENISLQTEVKSLGNREIMQNRFRQKEELNKEIEKIKSKILETENFLKLRESGNEERALLIEFINRQQKLLLELEKKRYFGSKRKKSHRSKKVKTPRKKTSRKRSRKVNKRRRSRK